MRVSGQRHASATFTPGKDPVPIVQQAGWAPGPVWTGAENLASTEIRSPDRPARSHFSNTSWMKTSNIQCRFTKYHTTNKYTNCMSFILNHFFRTLFTAATCFDSISLIIIREHIASPLASLHEKQRTQIQDMLPQQYYNEKVHIFNTWF